jgi:tripartite-type tricarboxylate transporter receptor subunit TctC
MTLRLPRIPRRALFCAGLATALLAPLGSAFAQASPTKPITLIVPWPPGGSTDRHRRTLAGIAGKHLGQNVIEQNQPGGDAIAQLPMGMLRIPHMQKTRWNPPTDFNFIPGVSGYSFGLVVKADSPHKSFTDCVEAARKAPGQIDCGSTGTGISPHLLLEELSSNAKVQFNHVPFKGNADLMQALLGGHVMAASDASGWDKFVEGGQTRLHDAFKQAVDDPRHVELLDQLNQDAWYRSGDEHAAWAHETFAKDKLLIERLGLAAK